jgi:hypothetical protein
MIVRSYGNDGAVVGIDMTVSTANKNKTRNANENKWIVRAKQPTSENRVTLEHQIDPGPLHVHQREAKILHRRLAMEIPCDGKTAVKEKRKKQRKK